MPPKEQRIGTLIKICGIRSADHARQALSAGADAVGVVIAPGSPRQASPSEAQAVAAVAGQRAVLVFTGQHPASPELLRDWPGPIQIHDPLSDPGRRYILASPIGAEAPPAAWAQPSARLLDAPVAGSGKPWEWNRPTGLGAAPLILAGGLNPDNVGQAIASAQPWAVDVSSGVERERGIKDFALVQAFIQAVRNADRQLGRNAIAQPPDFAALA